MAKKILLPLFFGLVLLHLPPSLIPTPFELRVVDDQTGAGVPVRIVSDNGIDRNTPNGYLYWWSSSLMSRNVRFAISDQTSEFDDTVATVLVTHGGRATVRLRRRT
jgi:hypothetical protein